MYRIFVNYRRGPHTVAVAALAEWLRHHFGDDEVFLDLGIRSGERYPEEIEQRLRGCAVLVSVIHDGWLATFDRPRPKDWVRHELATAFANGIAVLPVLLEDAAPPTREQLPPDIAELAMHQYAPLRAATLRSDVDNIAARVEHHTDLAPDAPPPAARRAPRAPGWRVAATAALFTLVTGTAFHRPGPLWQWFAMPAFGSAVLLACAALLTAITVWPLRGPTTRWGRRSATTGPREDMVRYWPLPALALIATTFFAARAIEVGGWQAWQAWLIAVVVLGMVALMQWAWRRATTGAEVWPPPVTAEPVVFRRAVLRLHHRLSTDQAWRHPRPRTAQRQAATVYFDLALARAELAADAALPARRWLRLGRTGAVRVVLGWAASVVALDLAAVGVLVFGAPAGWAPLRVVAITLAGAGVATGVAVWTLYAAHRYRCHAWITEITEWQAELGPVIFCGARQPRRGLVRGLG